MTKQTKDSVLALAEKVERASPSRDLDREVHIALHGPKLFKHCPEYTTHYEVVASLLPHPPRGSRYSISTHSALPWLRPSGRVHEQVKDEEAEGGWAHAQAPGNAHASHGETVTMAVLAAILRLRAHTGHYYGALRVRKHPALEMSV